MKLILNKKGRPVKAALQFDYNSAGLFNNNLFRSLVVANFYCKKVNPACKVRGIYFIGMVTGRLLSVIIADYQFAHGVKNI